MRALLLTAGMLVSMQVFATWIPFGPEGILSNSICFVVSIEYQFAICHDEGISLYDPVTQEWTTFNSDLPVLDAFYLDGIKMLVILNQDSDSDGIYTFDPDTEQFDVIEYLETPHFIYLDEGLQTFYVGYRFGLMSSQDGFTWNQVEALNNCNIVDMDVYQFNYVAAQLDNLYGVWYSNDAGISWNAPSPGSPLISNLGFDQLGNLYGIFPDESWSSGLWSSSDFGETWEVEFWSVNMSCVGFDVMNSVFVAWDENPTGIEEGIAHYDPESGNLNFMNEGLNSLVINEISVNPWMSAIALFCCTDSGAYINYDYIELAENSLSEQEAFFRVYPNPVNDNASIDYKLKNPSTDSKLCIYQPDGKKVFEQCLHQAEGQINIDLSMLPSGIYYGLLKNGQHQDCKKILIY
ncbi:MAG: T9SS type A sorting domain-containing protein [Bacteroidota bacterium]|nr:T9SS type A sorting domain-containing protein [Bacteroidota bacterium]